MSASATAPRALPRLLATVDLAQPLATLERDLLEWAGGSGQAPKNVEDFERIARALELLPSIANENTTLDLRLAIDAWEAARRRPATGFPGYVQIWQARLTTQRALGIGDEGRLRALQQQIGGILLDSRAAPYLLILPQPDGSYVCMGWESVVWYDRSPLGPQRKEARVLRLHELPAADRRYARTE